MNIKLRFLNLPIIHTKYNYDAIRIVCVVLDLGIPTNSSFSLSFR